MKTPYSSRAKIAIASDCNLRCRYCFVDKGRQEEMPLGVARNILDQIISSPGKEKSIGIYGGEPLLKFPLLRAIIEDARALESRFHKTVRLSIATNALFLNKENLVFFRDHGIRIAASCEGIYGGRIRLDQTGKDHATQTLKKIDLALRFLSEESLTALQVVHPENASSMSRNFSYLAKRGLRNFNFEIILGPNWASLHQIDFVKNFSRIRLALMISARSNRPLFLDPVNRFLIDRLYKQDPSPLIEITPSGRVSKIPYPLFHADGSTRLIKNGAQILALRNALCQDLAEDLISLSRLRAEYERYLQEALRRGVDF